MKPARTTAGADWTVEMWETHRAAAVACLAAHPGWIVGPAVIAMCDVWLTRLVSSP